MDPIHVTTDLEYAKKKFEAIMELVDKGRVIPHYPNSIDGHLIGRMGEDAVFQWAKRAGLKPFPNYQVTNQGCDIFLQGPRLRLEVKAWKIEQFKWGGRAISEKQMAGVRYKADRIVWCSVNLPTSEVKIEGWSDVKDFDGAPIVTKGKLDLRSYQLEKVRAIESFVQ